MFQKGEYVIYGNVGACQIIDISVLNIPGAPKDKLYYILQPTNQESSKIFTPIDNTKVVMRKVISKEEADFLLGDIQNIEELSIENEKLREQVYKDCIKNCECRDLLSLIKTIYLRKQERLNQGKKISVTDEKYFKKAIGNLHSELSISLGLSINQIEEYITKKVKLSN